MAIHNLTNISASEVFADFSFLNYFSAIKPLVVLVIGIVIYAFFIFKFYRFLARRDLLKLELHKHSKKFSGIFSNFLQVILYIIENIFLIPIAIFIWFAVLAALLLFLSKAHTPETVLITSIALVAAVRITAYYSEDLSRDLAKIVPFTLLGVFLIDYTSVFSVQTSIETASQILSLWKEMLYYLMFVIIVELVLRILQIMVSLARRGK